MDLAVQDPISMAIDVRAVLFDLDGLMFNTEDIYWEVGCQLLRRRGKRFTRQLAAAMMGRPPKAAFQVMIDCCSLDDSWQALQAETEELFLDRLASSLAPMPGLLELLAAVEAAGIPKGICTSSNRRFLHAVLTHGGMTDRFQVTLTSDDIVRGKPDPEIYAKAAELLGLPPERTLVFEDSVAGCRAAAAAGAVVIAVPNEHTRGHDFSMAWRVAESLADPQVYHALGLEPPGPSEAAAG